jgi:hypothetical protein
MTAGENSQLYTRCRAVAPPHCHCMVLLFDHCTLERHVSALDASFDNQFLPLCLRSYLSKFGNNVENLRSAKIGYFFCPIYLLSTVLSLQNPGIIGTTSSQRIWPPTGWVTGTDPWATGLPWTPPNHSACSHVYSSTDGQSWQPTWLEVLASPEPAPDCNGTAQTQISANSEQNAPSTMNTLTWT